MNERFNRPRVFLSHARKDLHFIERIEADFRKCQIDYWRDEEQIRDGQPWLEAIFEHGIPTCDAILAYFTDNSIESKMVAKEVDTPLIRRLQDSNVAFLPYVADDSVRNKLRVDLQTLQARVWNTENYHDVLPRVISEVWRSFLERTVTVTTSTERTKRLELELEVKILQENRSSSIFSNQEEAEFDYIRGVLDSPCQVWVPAYSQADDGKPSVEVGYWICSVSFLDFLTANKDEYYTGLPMHQNFFEVGGFVKHTIIANNPDGVVIGAIEDRGDFRAWLLRYGLVSQTPAETVFGRKETFFPYTEKMNRFVFWLEHEHVQSRFPLCTFLEYKAELRRKTLADT
jgi:hypothetical protein